MVPKYLSRFAELYQRQGRQVEMMDNKFWVNYGRMIIPIGPIHLDYSLSEDQARRLIKKFPRALMVRYTEGFHGPSNDKEWYAVTCDNYKELGQFQHENRRQIRRGLENCEVRKVDAEFIENYGYEVYASAFEKYQKVIAPVTKDIFVNKINFTKDFDDIYHYWAVIHNDKLIAYSIVANFDSVEACISVLKVIPEYLRLYPINALFYTMQKYYLHDNQMRFINAGFRSIFHKTNIHEFLIKKFGFNKVGLHLGITYKQYFLCFLKLTQPFSWLAGKRSSKLNAIYVLEDIRKKCAMAIN